MRRPITAFAILACASCAAPSSDEAGGGFGKADDLSPEDVPALFETYSIRSTSDFTYCESNDLQTCDNAETPMLVDMTMLLRVTGQDGDRFSGAITLCEGALSKDGEAKGTTEDTKYLNHGILARSGEHAVSGTLVAVDGQPALVLDPAAVVLGASLESPLADDLPTSKSDERVSDSDDDGKPGISIKLPLGRRIFLGARIISDSWQLMLAGDDSFHGAANYRVDVRVYGDTIPFVNARDEADDSFEKLLLPQHEHAIEMMPAGDTTCAQVIARFE